MSVQSKGTTMKLFSRIVNAVAFVALAAVGATASKAEANDCVSGANHVSLAEQPAGVSFTTYVNNAVAIAVDNGTQITVDATGMSGVQLNYLANQAGFIALDGISGSVALSQQNAALNMSALFSRICSGASVSVNATSMVNDQILIVDEFFVLVDSLSNLAADKTISVDASEVIGQTVGGTGTLAINSATLSGTSDLRGVASTINLTIPSPFSVSGASSELALRGNQLGALAFNGGGTLTIVGEIGQRDLAADASGVTLVFLNSSVASGSTLTLSVVQAADETIAGPGVVAIAGPDTVAVNTSFVNIENISIPATLTVASEIDFTLTAAQANGLVVAGSGRVVIEGGAIDANTSLTNLASTLDVASTTGSFSVATGAAFELTAAQADGLTIAGTGTGTTNIAGNVAANANFTLISTLLNIPGPVDEGATLTLTAAQGNGRTLGGAGSIALATADLSDSADFRGLTTAGFSFTGSIAAEKTVAINAVQAAGCAISGAGTVDILCTNASDSVAAGNISARVTVDGLANGDTIVTGSGNDSVSGAADDDILTAGAGNDAIDGGNGSDTANFASALASATFGAPSATFTLSSATDGNDTVTGVETLVFADATVLVANTGGSAIESLNDALAASETAKLYGNLEINAASFASDETASASYAALVARIVSGSAVTANAAGMNANQLGALAAGSTAFTGVSNLSITSTEDATEIAALLAKAADGAVAVNAAGMDGDQKGALATGIAKISAITALTVAATESGTEIATLATKAATFAVDANGMIDLQKDAVATAISQVTGIVNLALAASEDAGQIAALAAKCADDSVTVNASGMSDLQKGALVAADDKILSISALALASTESDTDIATLLAKVAAGGATADAASMDELQKGALSTAIAKLSSITNLALASSEDATEIANLLSKVAADGATANAASMDELQKGALSTAIAKLSSITALALASTEDATEIANLLSKVAADGATANAASMSDLQKGALSTAIAKLSSITALALA